MAPPMALISVVTPCRIGDHGAYLVHSSLNVKMVALEVQVKNMLWPNLQHGSTFSDQQPVKDNIFIYVSPCSITVALAALLSIQYMIAFDFMRLISTSVGVDMDSVQEKQVHPEDFRLYALAFRHHWTMRELYHRIAPEVPIFLHCPLMLPWVAARILQIPGPAAAEHVAELMTPATLHNHFRTMIHYANRPTVVLTKKEIAVEGMLITKVTHIGRAAIEEYIDLDLHSNENEEVEVKTVDGQKVTVTAYVYVWRGDLSLLDARHWGPLEYTRVPESYSATICELLLGHYLPKDTT